jgi:hypothetical protein
MDKPSASQHARLKAPAVPVKNQTINAKRKRARRERQAPL